MYNSKVEKIECRMLFTWVTRGTGTFSSICVSFVFFNLFRLSCMLLFYFFGIVGISTRNLDQFQFQSQLLICRFNWIVPMCLNFKVNAVLADWGNMRKILFLGQDIATTETFSRGSPETATIIALHQERGKLQKYFFATDWFVLDFLWWRIWLPALRL